MGHTERRKYTRHETEIGVTVHINGEEIPATLVDISPGGIGLISEKWICPGTEVNITMNYIDDYAIHGTVKWTLLITRESRTQYRLGIEADQILVQEDILGGGSS